MKRAIVLSLIVLVFFTLYIEGCTEFYSPCNAVDAGTYFVSTGSYQGNCYYCVPNYVQNGVDEWTLITFNPANTECYYCGPGDTFNPSNNVCHEPGSGANYQAETQYGTYVAGTPQCNCMAGDQWFTEETCVNCLIWYIYTGSYFEDCPRY